MAAALQSLQSARMNERLAWGRLTKAKAEAERRGATGLRPSSPEFKALDAAGRAHDAAYEAQTAAERTLARMYEAIDVGFGPGSSGGAWSPSGCVAEIRNWATKASAGKSNGLGSTLGKSPAFGLIHADEFQNAVGTAANYPEPTWRAPGFEPVAGPQLNLVDMINWLPSETENPQFMLETLLAQTATETPETLVAPETAVNYTPLNLFTKRLPVTLPASRQALDDALVLQDLLSNRLAYALKLRLQAQCIYGNGDLTVNTTNLRGILSTPGTLSVAVQTSGSPVNPTVDAIENAITAIRLGTGGWYEPSVLLIHPTDAQMLTELKSTISGYVFEPGRPLTPFGLRTVVTPAVNVTQPIVGCPESLTGFVRGDIFVALSDAHSDYFMRHLIQIYCEGRFALAVRQPAAWCQITGF
jgi:hypothetical protein